MKLAQTCNPVPGPSQGPKSYPNGAACNASDEATPEEAVTTARPNVGSPVSARNEHSQVCKNVPQAQALLGAWVFPNVRVN